MLDRISRHLDFQQAALNLRAKRAEVLASNIANDDTPYYKAVDFDFGKALQAATTAREQGGLKLAGTDARHLAAQGMAINTGGELQYRQAVQPSLDGNTVDMDIERGAFTDNAMRYQSTLTFMSKRITGLMDAIKGGQ